VEVVASLSQGRTAAAQCGLFTHKSVPVIFEPPCTLKHLNVKFKTFLAVTVHNKTELTAICWLSDNTTTMMHSVDFQNFQK